MAFDDGNEWGDFVGDTDEGGKDDGDFYEPPAEADPKDDGDFSEPPPEADPKDEDKAVIDESDDYSDTLPDFGRDDTPEQNIATAEKVLKIANSGIGVIESLVRSSGNKQAAAALAAVKASLNVGGDLLEFADKTVTKRGSKKRDDFDEVPVTVPTGKVDALEKVRRAIAQGRED